MLLLRFSPKGKETCQTGRFFLEFLDPLVEHGESELALTSLVRVAAVDHDRVEVPPLRHLLGQGVLLPYLSFPPRDGVLDSLDQVE